MSVTAADYITESEVIIEKLRRAADHIVASCEDGARSSIEGRRPEADDDLERPLMSKKEAKRVFQLLQITMTIEKMVECLTEEIRSAGDYLDACASGILEDGRDGDRDLCERCAAAYGILIEKNAQ